MLIARIIVSDGGTGFHPMLVPLLILAFIIVALIVLFKPRTMRRKSDCLQSKIDEQQRQIDNLKRELEEMKQKE